MWFVGLFGFLPLACARGMKTLLYNEENYDKIEETHETIEENHGRN
jgi:cadmium resistance protein CadD (predicted permease)